MSQAQSLKLLETMWIFSFLLFLPLFGLALGLSLLEWSHSANSSLEQTRLDAVSLSLCRQTENFLNLELLPSSSSIHGLQWTMTGIASSCIAVALAQSYNPVQAAATLARCRARLKKLETLGNSLEKSQKMLLLSFFEGNERELRSLLKENELNRARVAKRGLNFMDFEKEALRDIHKWTQSAFSLLTGNLNWPQAQTHKTPLENRSQVWLEYSGRRAWGSVIKPLGEVKAKPLSSSCFLEFGGKYESQI